MNIQTEYVLIMIILWVMAILMWIRKFDILIFRYEGFQKVIRKRSFTVNKEGVAKYYSIVFGIAGFVPLFYMLSSEVDFLIWVVYGLFIALIGSIVYLNITNRYLTFSE